MASAVDLRFGTLRYNPYVFLPQALRVQNFIELGAWFARYFGVPVSRQAIHYHAVSYGIQEVDVDYREYARPTYLKGRMTIASIQVDHGEYLYLAGKFGFEPALRKDAFRPLVWDEAEAARHSLTADAAWRLSQTVPGLGFKIAGQNRAIPFILDDPYSFRTDTRIH